MPWPAPIPGEISSRGAAVFESTPGLEGIDARSPNTVASAYVRINELSFWDLYFFQVYLSQELFVNTAIDYLPVHAAIWGVPQLQPTAASGYVLVAGAVGAPVPINLSFTSAAGQIYQSTAVVNIGSGGTALVPVAATVKGSAGNLAAGAVLTITSPVAKIYPQTGTVDSDGLTGGEDLEDIEDWRARILEKIRTTPMGGAKADYIAWAQNALTNVKYVNPVPRMFGLGTVGVVFAMAGPAIPSVGEVASVESYLEVVAPVTAEVTALAATFNPVNVSLHLNPDTTAIRGAATAALQLSFLQDAAIGGTTEFSRLDTAVASSDGEYSHDMLINGAQADVPAPSQLAMNILGTVSFT